MMRTSTLLGRMLLEEWRMHSTMFGRHRFAAFPLFVCVFTAAGTALLSTTGVAAEPLVLGLHILVGIFGLQTGLLAFIGTDAMRNVLGETTYLIFSARTLPVSQQQLLGVFLLKDLIFYAILFVLPITVGVLPLALTGTPGFALATLPILWVTLVATFILGVSITMVTISLSTGRIIGRVLALGGLVVFGVALITDVPVVAFTPYGFFKMATVRAAIPAFGLIPILLLLASRFYDPQHTRSARTRSNQYRRLTHFIPGRHAPIVAKMLLDVARSSGGLGKVFVSGGILLGTAWFLVRFATTIVGVQPSPGVAYAALLSLTTFTTYNWLTQIDGPGDYLYYPLAIPDIVAAKFWAFAALTVPVGGFFYGGVVVWHSVPLAETILGAFTFVGLSFYLFGVTVYLAGFDPNEFLFDTVLFIAFTVAVSIVLVPTILLAFLASQLTPKLALALVVIAIGAAGVGGVLYLYSSPKWDVIYRQG